MNIWSHFDQFPPILIRLLARRKWGPPLTDAEIAHGSGLPVHQVYLLSQLIDWNGVDVPTARAFMVGCRVNLENAERMKVIRAQLFHKGNKNYWLYLRRSAFWKTFYQPLMLRWRDSLLAKAQQKGTA